MQITYSNVSYRLKVGGFAALFQIAKPGASDMEKLAYPYLNAGTLSRIINDPQCEPGKEEDKEQIRTKALDRLREQLKGGDLDQLFIQNIKPRFLAQAMSSVDTSTDKGYSYANDFLHSIANRLDILKGQTVREYLIGVASTQGLPSTKNPLATEQSLALASFALALLFFEGNVTTAELDRIAGAHPHPDIAKILVAHNKADKSTHEKLMTFCADSERNEEKKKQYMEILEPAMYQDQFQYSSEDLLKLVKDPKCPDFVRMQLAQYAYLSDHMHSSTKYDPFLKYVLVEHPGDLKDGNTRKNVFNRVAALLKPADLKKLAACPFEQISDAAKKALESNTGIPGQGALTFEGLGMARYELERDISFTSENDIDKWKQLLALYYDLTRKGQSDKAKKVVLEFVRLLPMVRSWNPGALIELISDPSCPPEILKRIAQGMSIDEFRKGNFQRSAGHTGEPWFQGQTGQEYRRFRILPEKSARLHEEQRSCLDA